MSQPVYKILDRAAWEQFRAEGSFAGARIDVADGYVHLSSAAQVAETLAKHFAGEEGLVLVGLAPERLGDMLRWEPARGGALFPHVYGPLPIDAVVGHWPLPVDEEGRHLLPPLA